MVCVVRGREDCLQEALKLKGIDLKTRNQKGETLFEVALRHKHYHIQEIIKAGAELGQAQLKLALDLNSINLIS